MASRAGPPRTIWSLCLTPPNRARRRQPSRRAPSRLSVPSLRHVQPRSHRGRPRMRQLRLWQSCRAWVTLAALLLYSRARRPRMQRHSPLARTVERVMWRHTPGCRRRRPWRMTTAAYAAASEGEPLVSPESPLETSAPEDYGPSTDAHVVDAYPGPVPPVRPRAPPRPSEVYWYVGRLTTGLLRS